MYAASSEGTSKDPGSRARMAGLGGDSEQLAPCPGASSPVCSKLAASGGGGGGTTETAWFQVCKSCGFSPGFCK